MAVLPPATLKRKSSLPVWVSIGWRVLAVLALLALAVGVHWIERDGLKDTADGHVSFLDILYFTSISVTTTGYGDIVPVSNSARMFDAFVVTPIRVFVVLLFLGTAYNFVLKRTWDKWRMAVIQRTLSGHIIVAGYGTTGSETVDELIARGTDRGQIVVIDQNEANLARAKECGCIVLQADATRDQILEDVRIGSAESMIVCAGRDDTSILITLTARHLAPALPISVIVRNEDNELPARAAGATTVVNPVSFAGLLLAGSCQGTHLSDYLMDLASIHGRVQLKERKVHPGEIGKPLSAIATGLGVRIYRDGQPYSFAEPETHALLAGDTVLEIVTDQAVNP
ncbi:voltage-gated potassium channel [Sphingomonas naasensis]|uniref:Potassium transporter TrkA n=1 Tax=Sphingomonas naasensis TaxID=1344951 RepID=A0A4S1WUR4_9SPHN|nr:potassium channel family protein [Sphingomonas naasensis]NIJ18724.1 voltage-gated potassium channel [Sphingomonas naasensis]TGX45960.1 potassium transporter TrkA [Sphingomonas naasensis]